MTTDDQAEEEEETLWSGLETAGMREVKCSLLIQEDGTFEPRIKSLPKQRVLVYQDKGYNLATVNGRPQDENFYVDFNGCTILQLEPTPGSQQRTMPITLTVGGRCIFTPENYQDFKVMMRTKDQASEMQISPNGSFDWPDVESLLMCPLCRNEAPIPREGDDLDHEYWLLFYPLLQITVMKGSQMTLGTRTTCRLTCLECMEDLLEGMTLKVRPASLNGRRPALSFTLPANEVLAEAGSASFLEDGPPRPETHPHVDDILDAWTLYNLWEHSGAWEALQNDYRIVLSRSMRSDNGTNTVGSNQDVIQRKKSRGGNRTNQQPRGERRQRRHKLVTCDTCGKRQSYTRMKKCSRCRNATYCSIECQKKDWQNHKFVCKKIP